MNSDTPTRLAVTEEHAGKRLDRFLVDALPELSRARARALLEGGQVRVNGRRMHKGDPLEVGAEVVITGALPPQDFDPIAEDDATLRVIYEDADLVCFDKPAGLPTHPLRPDERGTLANVVAARYPETRGVGFHRREPGLMHRLDTDTSGVVLVARNAETFDALRLATREEKISKRYLALVEGVVAGEGTVEHPLVPHRKDPKRVEAVTEHVRLRAGTRTHPALTRYRVARAFDGFTLLEVELHAGYRHQVRVHLATLGHPLLGDALYRGPDVPAELEVTLGRHFLHASEVILTHPRTGAELRVVSPLPEDLAAVLGRLRAAQA